MRFDACCCCCCCGCAGAARKLLVVLLVVLPFLLLMAAGHLAQLADAASSAIASSAVGTDTRGGGKECRIARHPAAGW
jgi:hypothetical protein